MAMWDPWVEIRLQTITTISMLGTTADRAMEICPLRRLATFGPPSHRKSHWWLQTSLTNEMKKLGILQNEKFQGDIRKE
jgi:hypothetical protein